jgi:hypothetical protein
MNKLFALVAILFTSSLFATQVIHKTDHLYKFQIKYTIPFVEMIESKDKCEAHFLTSYKDVIIDGYLVIFDPTINPYGNRPSSFVSNSAVVYYSTNLKKDITGEYRKRSGRNYSTYVEEGLTEITFPYYRKELNQDDKDLVNEEGGRVQFTLCIGRSSSINTLVGNLTYNEFGWGIANGLIYVSAPAIFSWNEETKEFEVESAEGQAFVKSEVITNKSVKEAIGQAFESSDNKRSKGKKHFTSAFGSFKLERVSYRTDRSIKDELGVK